MITSRMPVHLFHDCIEYGDSSNKEVCGLLLGKIVDGRQYHHEVLYKMRNVSDLQQEIHYIPHPEDLFGGLKKTKHYTDDAEYDLTGVFHTHPRNLPVPSVTDIQGASYRGVFVIYSPLYKRLSMQFYDGIQQGFQKTRNIITEIHSFVTD